MQSFPCRINLLDEASNNRLSLRRPNAPPPSLI
jgi:hypothetical protein